jgi:internalin A
VTDLSPLSGLTALTSLYCSDTQVTDLSPLSGLTALTSLDCWDTQVTDLSPLSGLTALTSLDCSGTQVTDLSPLSGLDALTSLDCSDTQVTDLRVLIGLPHLQSLSANGCPMDDLPLTLVTKPTLEDLYLAQVTVPGIPFEVLSEAPHDSCLVRLRAHLEDLAHGVEPIRDVKLIVLGNGGVGKTQICRRLMGKIFDPTVPSTHGITIERTALGSDDRDPILNIWDFGGQDETSLRDYKLVTEFARHVDSMIAYLNDRCIPRDLDHLRDHGFAEILGLVGIQTPGSGTSTSLHGRRRS